MPAWFGKDQLSNSVSTLNASLLFRNCHTKSDHAAAEMDLNISKSVESDVACA